MYDHLSLLGQIGLRTYFEQNHMHRTPTEQTHEVGPRRNPWMIKLQKNVDLPPLNVVGKAYVSAHSVRVVRFIYFG